MNDFCMPKYIHPDFEQEHFKNAPNVPLIEVEKDGLSPKNYHALSVFPEYFKVNDQWILANQSRMDTVAVVTDEPGQEKVEVVEFRNLKKGDKVAIGRTEDGSEGIFVYTNGFDNSDCEKGEAKFAFRSGRSRETSFSKDYDELYDLLRYEKEHDGYVTWILGTATSLDMDSRNGLARLVKNGHVQAIFCGTAAVATDLEMGIFGTIQGQEEYLRDLNQRENYYEVINMVNDMGSIKALVDSGQVKDGFVKACVENNVDLVIAGNIRDRYTFKDTFNNVYDAQDEMRRHIKQSTTVIMTSAILFTIATGNMTPSYTQRNGEVRPVYIYTVDIQEFAVNKLSDRGTLTAKSVVTNSQDFIKNLDYNLTD